MKETLSPKKLEKRKAIAQKAMQLFLKEGIQESNISRIAKYADIGKGTIYQYFLNKDDIVFEIFENFAQEHEHALNTAFSTCTSNKEMLLTFFKFIIFVEKENEVLLPFIKEYMALSLTSKNPEFKRYNKEMYARYFALVESLITQGIQTGEIQNSLAHEFTVLLCAQAEGLLLFSHVTQDFDAGAQFKSVEKLIDLLFSANKV